MRKLVYERMGKRLKEIAWTYSVWFAIVNQRGNSTTCPYCGVKMERVKNRTMKCSKCGRRWNRDKVALWNVAKRALERVMKWMEENR